MFRFGDGLTHPEITRAEIFGMKEVEGISIQCDCGEIVPEETIETCTNCAHTGCHKCMIQDKETLDWFCKNEECIDEHYIDTEGMTRDEFYNEYYGEEEWARRKAREEMKE